MSLYDVLKLWGRAVKVGSNFGGVVNKLKVNLVRFKVVGKVVEKFIFLVRALVMLF